MSDTDRMEDLARQYLLAIERGDLFELTEDQSRFKSVRIIYDTAPVLVDFGEA